MARHKWPPATETDQVLEIWISGSHIDKYSIKITVFLDVLLVVHQILKLIIKFIPIRMSSCSVRLNGNEWQEEEWIINWKRQKRMKLWFNFNYHTDIFFEELKNAKLVLYADDTNILVVDKDITVLELKTSLVMTLLEAWHFDNELVLTLCLLTWRIRWAPNNASKWQMGFK